MSTIDIVMLAAFRRSTAASLGVTPPNPPPEPSANINVRTATFDKAREAFAKSKCSYRHVVYITDGSGGGFGGVTPSDAAVDRLKAANITMSIVLIEPRGTAVAEGLRAAAARAGGNFMSCSPTSGSASRRSSSRSRPS